MAVDRPRPRCTGERGAGYHWDERGKPRWNTSDRVLHRLNCLLSAYGHVGTADHNAFNSSVTAVLNINRDSMAAYGFSPPTRVFEAAGAGACVITDAWDGIEQFLEPGREILVARDGAEVAIADRTRPDAAKVVGERARRRVLAAHTYDHRATLVDGLLSGRAVREVAA